MEGDNKNPDNDESDFQPPIDDSGINNDHILDLCDFIIKMSWEKFIGKEIKPTADDLSIRDLKDLAYTMGAIWGLVQDIIDLDRHLRDNEDPPNFSIDEDDGDDY